MIDLLKPIKDKDFFLDTIDIIDSEYANSLVGKHIHFTHHDTKDNTVITMPGKVLEYNDGKLKIFTNDIIFDDDTNDDNNKMIEFIDINDISNLFVFDNYTKEYWNLVDTIDNNRIYTITNIYGNSIEGIISDMDSNIITILYKDLLNNVNSIEYPLYLISDIYER